MSSLNIMLILLIIPSVWLFIQIYIHHIKVDYDNLTGMMGFAGLMIIIWALPVLLRFNQAANIVKHAKEESLKQFKTLRYSLRLQENFNERYKDEIENLTMMMKQIKDHDLNYQILFFFQINPTTQASILSFMSGTIISIVSAFVKQNG